MEVDWRVTTTGGLLHAVRRKKGNRSALCFYLCEVPPYPKHRQEKLDKNPPRKCTKCEQKLRLLLEEEAARAAKSKKRKTKETNG